jgi:hypothetical protein
MGKRTDRSSIIQRLWKFARQPPFLALVYFGVMTLIMTYPLVFHMREVVGGAGGDGTYFIWLVRWYQKALFELRISPFFDPNLNYPQGWNLASTDITPAMAAMALPGSLLFGQTWGYNSAMLASFVLAGWGMYLWARSLTKNELAGLAAGTIFAFLPFHMAHVIIGHLSLAGTQWFPFYFWGLFDLLRQERFSWKPVLMASISIGLIGFTSPYYVYMTILMTAVFFAGYILFRGWKRLKEGVFWKSLVFFGLAGGALTATAMQPYLNLNAQNGLAARPVDYVSTYSASPTDYVLPSIHQFLWGKWIDDRFSPETWQESTLYIGLVTLGLAVVAWVKRRRIGQIQLLGIMALVAFSAFVLSLGVDLHWLGQKVVSLPRFLQGLFHRTDMPEIHLPAYYLYLYLPFFSKMRVMMRFGLFTLTAFSLAAGLGAQALLDQTAQKRRIWVGVGLLVLIMIDFHPGRLTGFEKVDARPVDYWLAAQPDIGAVAQFPFSEESDQGQVYNTLVSQKPFLGGFFNANHPEQFERILPVMEQFPSAESAALLKQLGAAYIVVDSSQYSNYPEVDQQIGELGLKLLNVSEAEYVYGWP